MRLMRGIPLFAMAGVLAASCSHAPRLATAPAARDEFRAEYLRNNPEGKFNRNIMNGEVIRGMGSMEVLASWGLPNLRRAGVGDRSEYWTYYSLDDHTKTYTSYALVFENHVLSRWVIEDNINSYDALVQRNLIGTPSSRRPIEPESGAISDGTLKKKP